MSEYDCISWVEWGVGVRVLELGCLWAVVDDGKGFVCSAYDVCYGAVSFGMKACGEGDLVIGDVLVDEVHDGSGDMRWSSYEVSGCDLSDDCGSGSAVIAYHGCDHANVPRDGW